MNRPIIRRYCLDGDTCEVLFFYDTQCERHFGEYPDFEETPRYTENGWPWVTAMQDGCPHGINRYSQEERCLDCGSCQFFRQEQQSDLVGICSNEKQRLCESHR